jgi:hypothetical protein
VIGLVLALTFVLGGGAACAALGAHAAGGLRLLLTVDFWRDAPGRS